MDLSTAPHCGIDPGDVQAQVEELYAHILACVDVSLDNDEDNDHDGAAFASKTVAVAGSKQKRRHVHQSPQSPVAGCPCCGRDGIAEASASTTTADRATFSSSPAQACCCHCHCSQQQERHSTHITDARSDQRAAMPEALFQSAARALSHRTGGVSAAMQRPPPSTFGSGRKGMSEPVKKTTIPGPGSYFCSAADNSVRHTLSSRNMSAHSGRHGATAATRTAADEAKSLKRQFALLCQCYWKQFPELETPTNPAAHATNCPCQSIRAASPRSESSRSDSSGGKSNSSKASMCDGKKSRWRARSNTHVSPPRLGVRRGNERGAVFGTSPRRTIFAGASRDNADNDQAVKSDKKRQEKRGAHAEDASNGAPRGVAEDPNVARNKTPSRGRRPTGVATPPGPGAYNVASAFDATAKKGTARGVSIGRAARQLHTLTDAPGPGTYSTETKVATDVQPKKKYFLTTSPRALQLVAAKEDKDRPGPGEYRTETSMRTDARHKNAPSFSFGRAKLPECAKALFTPAENADEVPGPGTYDISTAMPDSSAAAGGKRGAIITTASRGDNMWRGVPFQPDDVPGPGTYTLTEEKKGPAYSLRLRPIERVEPTPGPGHYVLPKEMSGQQWTMSSRWSSPPKQEPTPGPGDYSVPIYDLRRAHSTAPLFTTAPRLLHEAADQAALIPGPGAYDTNNPADLTRTVVMGTAQRTLLFEGSSERVPGPGSYVVQYTGQERRVAAPLLGVTAPRFDKDDLGASTGPALGPGYYDMDAQLTLANRRSAVVGSAPRPLLFDAHAAATDAGPGAYDIAVPRDGPSFSIRHRPVDTTTPEKLMPGPGLYDPYDSPVGPSAVMGSAVRFQPSDKEKARGEIPGPGAYTDVAHLSGSPAAVFGTSPRLIHPEDATGGCNSGNGLGPGSYDPQLATGNVAGAAWSIGPRFAEDGRSEAPGPGAYEISSHSPTRDVFFGTAGDRSDWLLPTDAATLPGPGSYLPQNLQERVSPAVVLGSSPRHLPLPEERETLMRVNIGPGTYDVAYPSSHVFHATVGSAGVGRPEEKRIDLTPGPGQYTPAGPHVPQPRSVVFGTASRMPLQLEDYEAPGPGAYARTDVAAATGLPAGPVTFPSAPRFNNAGGIATDGNNGSSGTPGPGAYAVEKQGERTIGGGGGGGAVIGTGPRVLGHEDRKRALLPGPGQYQPFSNLTVASAPAYPFGTGPRMMLNGDSGGDHNGDVPGPGTYDVIVPTFTAPTTRFGTEARSMGPLVLAELPGPGAYDTTEATVALGPAYRFPTAPRELHAAISETPGPGQYDGNNTEVGAWRRVDAPSFPTGPRFFMANDNSLLPGPGQYTPHHPQWVASQVHFFPTGGRDPPSKDDELPGPGTYNPKQLSPSPAAPVFGTEPRRMVATTGDPSSSTTHPGPGYYSPALPLEGPSIRFGTAERGIVYEGNDNEDTPGPGTYDVARKTNEGPAFSMHRTAPRGPTLVEVEKSQLPGPGAYMIPPAFPATDGAGAAVSFLKEVRFQVPASAQQEAPGPGFYNPQSPESAAGPIIGRAPRLAEVGFAAGSAEMPGPGHYEVGGGNPITTNTVDGGVAMRFTSARFTEGGEATAPDAPGPASYNPVDTRGMAPAASFPQASRFVVAELPNGVGHPGPGEYSIPSVWHQSAATGYSFGTSTRAQLGDAAQQDMPGPGSYDADRYAARFLAGPAFTLQGRPTYGDERTAADYPGPGAYCPRPVETARATSFGVPPTVDPEAVFAARVNATPGPTAYDIPTTLSRQAVTIGTADRTEKQTEDLPGPGAYLTGGPVVLPSQPAFSFGYASRPDIAPRSQYDAPGPGEYHHPIDPKPSVPVFTFAGAERFGEGGTFNGIGPGQYYHSGPLEAQDGPAFSFPIAQRNATTATGSTMAGVATASGAGPGAYYHPHHWELTGRGPSFPTTMGHYPPRPGADTPGPGAYHVEPRASAPGTTAAAVAADFRTERQSLQRVPAQTVTE
ncbi:hypothetical protein DQ04_02901020 [Trypanosoma grayi]|uniref:hypothetical protein n=1 Tax=Trypanosoma grayi TaxID=71804 RepID=UPI0004F48F2D|nr:hypothetical protein DQ04_02901020 [Trypanosoma grayi]KEG11172.1 hypothetical protein DQ04_02901020 [Trypanosoma grayi]